MTKTITETKIHVFVDNILIMFVNLKDLKNKTPKNNKFMIIFRTTNAFQRRERSKETP